ncbi:hypothetical protein Mycch_0391 [Mycolicibacterium chubuense NBB4]|uniref:Uncharacterized protein n=1 Tax=Mycolicibacterium chubuense (strain NBB4) TaxID=710421 RepID=I4BD54_MYCCN|nr:hypothetical protein [Mycolicibacterium chubuense]AFM15211.1 hypothetical protein Mycch_0391 [Mycolicibacterium chubuense NBB4]
MSENPEPETAPTPEETNPPYHSDYAVRTEKRRRLPAAAVKVGAAAAGVLVAAGIFFSGFFLGESHNGHAGHHRRADTASQQGGFTHRGERHHRGSRDGTQPPAPSPSPQPGRQPS